MATAIAHECKSHDVVTRRQLVRILNRRIKALELEDGRSPCRFEIGGCSCDRCSAQRARPFCCGLCGYDGEPDVPRCSGEETWRESLKDAKARVSRPLEPHSTRNDVLLNLGWVVSREQSWPCAALDDLGHHDCFDDCVHGYRFCPICGVRDGDEELEPRDDIPDPWAMIREVRAALGSL